jgi:formylglycine-generating enzyme required for sulfatase activity
MPQCPVCQVKYVSDETECCPVCSWNVQPLTLLTGLIPEVAERESVRLKWAKSLWNSVQEQRHQLYQLQLQLKEAVEQTQQIQNQLTQVSLEDTARAETLHPYEITLSNLQHPLQQTKQEQTELVCIEPKAKETEPGETKPGEVELGDPEVKFLEAIDLLAANIQQTQLIMSPVKASSMNHPILETIQIQEPIFSSAKFPISAKSSEPATSTDLDQPLDQLALQEFVFDGVTIQQQQLKHRKHKAFGLHQSLEAGVNLEMVLVPGGTFWMGSLESEAERDSNEAPQHEVTIAPFYLSKFPITQAQWRSIATLPKIKRSLSLYPSNFKGDHRPVEQVSWYDAIEFCARLSQKIGQLYRLPSEAEWEYACRAGTTTPFHFGDTILPDLANYDGNYAYGTGFQGSYRQETTPVGMFQTANAFGLSDMHGNVWEWCADPWHENYQNAPIDGSIWRSDEEVTYQVLRGGAWYCLPGLCRSAQRHWNQLDVGGSGIGFRVVFMLS